MWDWEILILYSSPLLVSHPGFIMGLKFCFCFFSSSHSLSVLFPVFFFLPIIQWVLGKRLAQCVRERHPGDSRCCQGNSREAGESSRADGWSQWFVPEMAGCLLLHHRNVWTTRTPRPLCPENHNPEYKIPRLSTKAALAKPAMSVKLRIRPLLKGIIIGEREREFGKSPIIKGCFRMRDNIKENH